MNIQQFFDYVKSIPYEKDIPDQEVVSRPLYLLRLFPSLDCKKKAILMSSFINLKYGPRAWRLCLSSNRPDGKITHIFPQFNNGKTWLNVDATYNHNTFAGKKRVTNIEFV